MKKIYTLKLNCNTGDIYCDDRRLGRINPAERLIFIALVEAKGSLIHKEQLLELAWPNKFVTPNSLNVAIKNIRQVLARLAADDFIITHMGKGFSWNNPCDVQFFNETQQECFQVQNEQISANVSIAPHDTTQKIEGSILSKENTFNPGSDNIKKNKTLLLLKTLGANQSKIKTIGYYLLVTCLLFLIMIQVSFYFSQRTGLECHRINEAEFCGIGEFPHDSIPSTIKNGQYIYTYSVKNGLAYVKIK